VLGELADVLGLKQEHATTPENDATAIGPSEAKLNALIEQRPVTKASKDLRRPIRTAHSCWSAATN